MNYNPQPLAINSDLVKSSMQARHSKYESSYKFITSQHMSEIYGETSAHSSRGSKSCSSFLARICICLSLTPKMKAGIHGMKNLTYKETFLHTCERFDRQKSGFSWHEDLYRQGNF